MSLHSYFCMSVWGSISLLCFEDGKSYDRVIIQILGSQAAFLIRRLTEERQNERKLRDMKYPCWAYLSIVDCAWFCMIVHVAGWGPTSKFAHFGQPDCEGNAPCSPGRHFHPKIGVSPKEFIWLRKCSQQINLWLWDGLCSCAESLKRLFPLPKVSQSIEFTAQFTEAFGCRMSFSPVHAELSWARWTSLYKSTSWLRLLRHGQTNFRLLKFFGHLWPT